MRYLHSDIDTVERVEIIRDLRLGEFDVLVGINLLREGPGHSRRCRWWRSSTPTRRLPALDALRIQTIGRAVARQWQWRFLYADSINGLDEAAMGETERRRTKQIAFNGRNGSCRKASLAISGRLRSTASTMPREEKRTAKEAKVKKEFAALDGVGREKTLSLRNETDAAKNLEFEKGRRAARSARKLKRRDVWCVGHAGGTG